MKDVTELLRAKERELLKVKRQVEALRIALPLLSAEEDPPAADDEARQRRNRESELILHPPPEASAHTLA